MLVDSHCHLDYLEDPRQGMRVEDVLRRAAEAGVGHMLSVAVDRSPPAAPATAADGGVTGAGRGGDQP